MRDNNLIFSTDQDLSGGTSMTGYKSDTFLDKLSVKSSFGVSAVPLFLVVLLTEALDDGSDDAALNVYYAEADNGAGTSNLANILLAGTFAADAPAKSRLVVPIPPFSESKQFVGLFYQSTNHQLTAGKVSAWITDEVFDSWKAFPKGFTVFPS